MQLKYIMGHTHCNKVTATDPRGGPTSALGMMVAGQGMEGCGNFGVPLVSTKEKGRVEVLYYEIQSTEKGSTTTTTRCPSAGRSTVSRDARVWRTSG